MINCQLTKLETALDAVKKAHPKLKPADAGLLASALTLTGRHAIAVYDGQDYVWPTDTEKIAKAMTAEIKLLSENIEATTPKRSSKTAVEEEPVSVAVGLKPNLTAGEQILQDRKDLKTLLSDVIHEGVEFVYYPADIGWQWALDRVNWNTVAGVDVSRRISVKTSFTEGAVGVEQGATGPKRRTKKASAEPAE